LFTSGWFPVKKIVLDAIIIVVLFGILAVILYLLVQKVKDIKDTAWLECKQFPYNNGKHICRMVEHCLSKGAAYQKSNDASHLFIDKTSHTNLYGKFLSEIKYCFMHCSQHSLQMTLPQNPYIQLEKDKKGLHETAEHIDAAKLQTVEKKICLKGVELKGFIDRLSEDIRDNFLKKQDTDTEFEEYIKLHNEKGINLSWHCPSENTTIEEYIIIDDTAVILYDEPESKINIDFSIEKSNEYRTNFRSIMGAKTTKQFIEKYVLKEIKKKDYLQENWDRVNKYLMDIIT
jgi:hypothetical protein